MRVKRAERETHDDFALRLGVDLGKKGVRAEVRLRARPIQADKFGFPAARVDEIHKRLEAALGAGHRRNNGKQGHAPTYGAVPENVNRLPGRG